MYIIQFLPQTDLAVEARARSFVCALALSSRAILVTKQTFWMLWSSGSLSSPPLVWHSDAQWHEFGYILEESLIRIFQSFET